MCRVCKEHKETLPHVINHCQPLLHRATARHNKIVERVKNAACGWKILYENQPIHNSGFKPDLVLLRHGHIMILDVTYPFDDGIGCFNKAHKDKCEKYKPLLDYFKNKYKSVTIDAIIAGSLGSWDPKNDRVLIRFCTKKYLNLMKRLTISEVIRSSRDMYIQHVDPNHAPQTDYRNRRYWNQHRRQLQNGDREIYPLIDPNPTDPDLIELTNLTSANNYNCSAPSAYQSCSPQSTPSDSVDTLPQPQINPSHNDNNISLAKSPRNNTPTVRQPESVVRRIVKSVNTESIEIINSDGVYS